MYTCGPTVYGEVQIGNIRTLLHSNMVSRTFKFLGYQVEDVINVTDLDDKIEKVAVLENKPASQIATFYTEKFLETLKKLNISLPSKLTKATDYIKDQIFLIRILEEKGYTYQISDGIYFNTGRFPDYKNYVNETGEEAVSRIGPSSEKLSSSDFALWKFLAKDEKRGLVYDSPWGKGYPGWHIECSSMILRELGDTIDIHIGGEDLKMTHHPNEIAQSECATGAKFVNYWMHVAFLTVNNEKMSKSLGNFVTVPQIQEKGFDLISLKYYFMTTHYRTPLNFSLEALTASQNALHRIYEFASKVRVKEETVFIDEFLESFAQSLMDDFNTPSAIAEMWKMLSSDYSDEQKLTTLIRMDEVLGLNILNYVGFEIPKEVMELAHTRWVYKKQGIFDKADFLRREIEKLGYEILDKSDEFVVKRRLG